MKRFHKHRALLLVTSLAVLLPTFVGLLLWSQLPDQLPTHFDFSGQPDDWSSRAVTVFGLPLILLAVHLICLYFTLPTSKRAVTGKKVYTLLFWSIPAISCFCLFLIYAKALEFPVDIRVMTDLLLGIFFLIIGNYLGKIRQNSALGIRLPWTLTSTENWNRTHRVGGPCFMVGGLLFLADTLLASSLLFWAALAVSVVIPTLYSYLLHQKGI